MDPRAAELVRAPREHKSIMAIFFFKIIVYRILKMSKHPENFLLFTILLVLLLFCIVISKFIILPDTIHSPSSAVIDE